MKSLLFVFLLTTYVDGAMDQMEVADYDLTGSDCIQRLVDYHAAHPDFVETVPSCELQHGAIANWIWTDD